jgi:ketosteroid isomerase-like protein
MTAATPALLQTIYAAYREKRLADVLALLADDFRFTIHLPADALPGAGVPHDKAATATLLEGLIASYAFLAYEPGPIMVTGEEAAVRVRIRYRHKATGEAIETTLGHFWRVRDGKATQLDEYHDVQHVTSFLSKVGDVRQ